MITSNGIGLEAKITMRVGRIRILSVSAMGAQVQLTDLDGNPTNQSVWVPVGGQVEVSGTVEIT